MCPGIGGLYSAIVASSIAQLDGCDAALVVVDIASLAQLAINPVEPSKRIFCLRRPSSSHGIKGISARSVGCFDPLAMSAILALVLADDTARHQTAQSNPKKKSMQI